MAKRNSRFEDILTCEVFTGADYCEAADLLAYGTAGKPVRLKNLKTGKEWTVTAGGKGEGNPRFSPDGTQLLFLSAAGCAGRQIFVYDLKTEKVRQITFQPSGVTDPLWSPDGTRILFASPSGGRAQAERKPDEAIVIENFGYKFDGMGFFRPDRYTQLFTVAAEGGPVRQLTDGPFHHMHHNWSVDGKAVFCLSGRFRPKAESIGVDLLLIEDGGACAMTRLTSGQSAVSYPNPLRPVMTADGKYIITGFLPEEEPEDGTYPDIYLYRVAVDSGRMEQIFQPDERCIQCVQFPYNAFCGRGFDKLQLTDDGAVLFQSGWEGRCGLYRLELSGDGRAKPLVLEKRAVNGIGRVQNGKALVAMSEPDIPEYYAVLDVRRGEILARAAQSAEDLYSSVAFSKPEDFSIGTGDGSGRVHGWVLPPQNREPGKKYPAILCIHGGPHPFYTYGFTHEHQCFAGAGYAVIYCNPRGSSGYGQAHQRTSQAFDGSAYQDLLRFTEEACRRYDFIDPGRIGVTGGSYGGYMTNYIAVQGDRHFRAFVSQRSMVSEVINYGSRDIHTSSMAFDNFGDFLRDALEHSVISYVERVNCPFLILHGADDCRTPVEGAHQLFTALKDLKPALPVRMVIYPHTAHGQPNDPKQLQHYYREMLRWFDTYLSSETQN